MFSGSLFQLRVLMYIFQVAALDEDTQKLGLHLITHRLRSQESSTGTVEEDAWITSAEERAAMKRFFACTSVRCSIIHVNAPSLEKWARIVPCTIKIFAADERGRILFHHGECRATTKLFFVQLEQCSSRNQEMLRRFLTCRFVSSFLCRFDR